MGKTVACQNCHGNGTILKEVSPGKWEEKKCTACNGTGKVNTGLI